jgi:hypothetical protein
MKKILNTNKFINAVKLADDTILALSSLERGHKAPKGILEGGIKLCDYFLSVFQTQQITDIERDQSILFHVARDTEAIIKKDKINIENEVEKITDIKKCLGDLISDPKSHNKEEIKTIQIYLIAKTTPIWQGRLFKDKSR